MRGRGNPYVFVAMGGILAALPFLGFPTFWETAFEVVVGAFIFLTGVMAWWSARANRGRADTYVESARTKEEHVHEGIVSVPELPRPQVAPIAPVVTPLPSPQPHLARAPIAMRDVQPGPARASVLPKELKETFAVSEPAPAVVPKVIEQKETAKPARPAPRAAAAAARSRAPRKKPVVRRKTAKSAEVVGAGGFSTGNWE